MYPFIYLMLFIVFKNKEKQLLFKQIIKKSNRKYNKKDANIK